jgi:hypothetical protein
MFKKVVFFSLIFVILLSSAAFAEGTTSFLSINPLGLIWGTANIEYSHSISDNQVIAIRAIYEPIFLGIYEIATWWHPYPYETISTIGIGASYRTFFGDTAFVGPYWGVGLNYRTLLPSYTRYSYSNATLLTMLEPVLEVGSIIFRTNFGITLGANAYAGYLLYLKSNSISGFFTYGIGLQIGYSW